MRRYAVAIFSDDIRREETGKLIYIGTYNDVLFSQRFPLHMIKLCVTVLMYTPASEPISKAKLEIVFNEQQSFAIDIDVDTADLMAVTSSSGETMNCVRMEFVAQNYVFNEPGVLKVNIVADGELIPCVGLNIKQGPPSGAEASH